MGDFRRVGMFLGDLVGGSDDGGYLLVFDGLEGGGFGIGCIYEEKRLLDWMNEYFFGWFYGGFVFGMMGDFLNNLFVFFFFVWYEVLRFCLILFISESVGRDVDGRVGDFGGYLRG